ncbi:hypothetical protein O181_067392, partial [Austropuccinia psidii MF-1]|nr:hypothetical protein [Austropuccinia psidii MF-1]
TLNSLVTTYEGASRPLFNQEDMPESLNSPKFNRIHGDNSIISISETQRESQGTMEETPSQASGQQRKRQTHEEAQLHWQKQEHKRSLKQQKKISKQVNAEAQQLQQAESCLAHQEAQKQQKSHFFCSEDSKKELLDLMMELQMDFENMESTLLGFVPWSQYFKSHEHWKHDYVTLKNLTFETLDRRYKELMTTFRVYEMLKRIKTNNCGLNATGMESGTFPQPLTAVGNTQNLENNENKRREDNMSNGGDQSGSENDNTQSGNAHADVKIRHNEDIFSLLLNGQEQADERDWLKRAQEDAREERHLEWEEERRKEEKACNDQMNMFMMTLLTKVTGIDQDQLPRV